MNLIIPLIIGVLFSASLFLMFQKSFFKLIIGVILFGYATTFFLFTVGGVTKNAPPLLSEAEVTALLPITGVSLSAVTLIVKL